MHLEVLNCARRLLAVHLEVLNCARRTFADQKVMLQMLQAFEVITKSAFHCPANFVAKFLIGVALNPGRCGRRVAISHGAQLAVKSFVGEIAEAVVPFLAAEGAHALSTAARKVTQDPAFLQLLTANFPSSNPGEKLQG